jgi:Fe-S-cluster-containing dehydrogenase component/anaerobic selenocysteine-containing dehydrogenase
MPREKCDVDRPALPGPEFPPHAEEWTDPVTRRQFLTLMGASLALAGAGGCSTQPAPRGQIFPYARQPERLTPGIPLEFATTLTLTGAGVGVLVESHEGRPTKVEGNPDHPASRGASDLHSQAAILGLYDPDRSQSVTYRGRPRAWAEAIHALRIALDRLKDDKGKGLRILTGTVTSPSLAEVLARVEKDYPGAKWVQYEPASRDTVRAGSRLAFGKVVNTYYDLRQADVILSLDADFLSSGPGTLPYTRDFSARRRLDAEGGMNRLYVVEPLPSPTGAVADHRLALSAGVVEDFARALARRLGVEGLSEVSLPETARGWIEPLARDLEAHKGKCVVIPGPFQPARVHALAHRINRALENPGKTMFHTEPIEARPADEASDLAALVDDMNGGKVGVLLILGSNPVYDTPADIDFGRALDRVPFRAHLGLYQDETAVRCDWHLPEAHPLESWGDARAYDGSASLVQPLIGPLYGGRTAVELLDTLRPFADETETETPGRNGREIVRDHWQRWHSKNGSGDFERFWQEALQKGVLPEEAGLPRVQPSPAADWLQGVGKEKTGTDPEGLEIVFRPDPAVYDGRFANNAWLQELPRPITKLTWGNAALMSPNTARELGIAYVKGSANEPAWTGGEHGQGIADVVELTYRDRTLRAPAWILPGHADGCVTVHLGFGRERAGRVGNKVGFNAYTLRTADEPWSDTGLEARKSGATERMACTQMHQRMQGRDLILHGPSGKKHHEAGPAKDRRLTPLTLYTEGEQEFPYNARKWGMVIDLATCTGCSACVVACQAENNISVVGKEEVIRGREMHWLRIDRYFKAKGPADPDPLPGTDITILHQPVPCMHCENAPCELVCPVEATVHSHDGLNDMIYNRCVGTRYCSNNCPYKVRRFNFLQFADFTTESLKLGRNPDVTVRSRGVMEKCTYCVQRIRTAEIAAEKERRPVRDGEIVTACQQACPAGAIVFGDLNDPKSAVHRLHGDERNYGLLEELNLHTRTTYLTVLRNPNPEMP